MDDNTSRFQYIDTVIRVIENHNSHYGNKMLVKLLLSIDRGKAFVEAKETIDYAIERVHAQDDSVLVGIDFSGNFQAGRFVDFVSLLEKARAAGLKITVHVAESMELSGLTAVKSDNKDFIDDDSSKFTIMGGKGSRNNNDDEDNDDETSVIFNFRPDRMGHAIFLGKKHWNTLINRMKEDKAIPIEICPTSNFYTTGVRSYSDLPHVRKLIDLGYPISINTDDAGLFMTSLTQEFVHVKQSFGLTIQDMYDLSGKYVVDNNICNDRLHD